MFNILAFGSLGSMAYFSSEFSQVFIFQENHAVTSLGINIFGAFWLSFSICSAIGITYTHLFSPINVLQTFMMFLILISNVALYILGDRYIEGLLYFSLLYFIILLMFMPWKALMKIELEQFLKERLKELNEEREGLL